MGIFLTRGQAPAVEAVGVMIAAGMPQALLLVGPASVGKTTLGLDIAAGLLCGAALAADRPCRECRGCRLVAHGNHPDLHRVAPAGPGGQILVDQVRALIEEIALLPMEGSERVVLIETAHRLNEDAQNILLKTLEEPPAGLTIMLAADEEDALLPTVRSRAARLRLGPVPSRAIEKLLVEAAGQDPADAARIARLAGGRPGLAMAYAAATDAMRMRAELSRAFLDLFARGRAARLAAVREQVARANELVAALSPPPGGSDETPAKGARRRTRKGAAPATVKAAAAGEIATDGGEGGAESSAPAAKGSASERRRAAATLLTIWRDVASDLVRVQLGDAGAIREPDLLEEYRGLVLAVSAADLGGFLVRLDDAMSMLDANANAELLLDVTALAVPRIAATG
jgi:DNA polymerase-3 subunit delta'